MYAEASGIVDKDVSREAEHVKVGDLILFYLLEHAEEIEALPGAKRREKLSHIERLSAFWGDKFVSEINRKNSREYQKGKKQSVVRNEMIAFRAIINYAASESQLKKYDNQLNFSMPEGLPSRIHYYSIDELITLYKAAMRRRHSYHGKPTYRVADHIAKFILVAVLTGSRSGVIGRASFVQEPGRPWVDLENGIFYRAAKGAFVPLNKRADPVLIPARLLKLMKRWHYKDGCKYLIQYQGRAVDCRKGFYTLKTDILPPERAEVLNRHSLKHTAVTTLLKLGVSISDVADYVSTTEAMLRKTYKHIIPGEFSAVHQALDKKQPRRPRPGEKKAA